MNSPLPRVVPGIRFWHPHHHYYCTSGARLMVDLAPLGDNGMWPDALSAAEKQSIQLNCFSWCSHVAIVETCMDWPYPVFPGRWWQIQYCFDDVKSDKSALLLTIIRDQVLTPCVHFRNRIEWQLKSLILATDITRQQEYLCKFKVRNFTTSFVLNYLTNFKLQLLNTLLIGIFSLCLNWKWCIVCIQLVPKEYLNQTWRSILAFFPFQTLNENDDLDMRKAEHRHFMMQVNNWWHDMIWSR